MKIVFTDCKTMNPGDIKWNDYFDVEELTLYDHTAEDELVERIIEAEIVVVNKTVLTKELLSKCHSLQCICVSATGFNNVDVKYAAEMGIPVLNAANYSDNSVAQHVLAMTLNELNKVAYYDRTVKQGRWQNSRDFTYYDEPIEELGAKTVGFIGYGSLGQATAKLFKAFGAKIVVMEYPHRKVEVKETDIEILAEADFFKTAEIISIHVPLTEKTEGMVSTAFLAKMREDAILINTSRGGVVNEDDLAWALKNGKLRSACLDVLTAEPPSGSALIGLQNCTITPHQAWASKQARMRLMRIVSENISAFKKGEERNRVN